jgi:hypothetical protein
MREGMGISQRWWMGETGGLATRRYGTHLATSLAQNCHSRDHRPRPQDVLQPRGTRRVRPGIRRPITRASPLFLAFTSPFHAPQPSPRPGKNTGLGAENSSQRQEHRSLEPGHDHGGLAVLFSSGATATTPENTPASADTILFQLSVILL